MFVLGKKEIQSCTLNYILVSNSIILKNKIVQYESFKNKHRKFKNVIPKNVSYLIMEGIIYKANTKTFFLEYARVCISLY